MTSLTSNDDAVLGVGAPGLEQLPGQPGLHHAGGRHDHAWADVFEVVYALKQKYTYLLDFGISLLMYEHSKF